MLWPSYRMAGPIQGRRHTRLSCCSGNARHSDLGITLPQTLVPDQVPIVGYSKRSDQSRGKVRPSPDVSAFFLS